jgi:Bacteriophage tail sheath protein
MSRVIFDDQPIPPQLDPGRADIACFVGLARLLPGASLPAGTVSWLGSLGYASTQIAQIINVPVLIERYSGFASIFDDGSGGTGYGTDYVATAVRSFFAQGGRRCYVVRTGDPVTPQDTARDKANKLASLLPGIAYAPDVAGSWTGISSLASLIDASFLVTPDLPILCASGQDGAVGQEPAQSSGPEEFVVCSQADITPRQSRTFPQPAPRLSSADYQTWATNVAAILNYLASGNLTQQLHLREIQFVTAFPIPQNLDPATAAENPSSAEIAQDIHEVIGAQMPEIVIPVGMVPVGNISSSFLQLAYPWLKTSGSSVLLEGLEPPDGVLAGLLARNALTRGTFTSATKITPAEVYDISPSLPAWEMQSSSQPLVWGASSPTAQPKALIERLSLFGFTPGGLRLLSDVTAYPGESYRSGPVNRLVSVICRAARRMGESAVFASNGPALWGSVQSFMTSLLNRLWTLNALAGASATDAFSVRCDRTTMTQNDLDNGRLICQVTFTAASTIETITVKLDMGTSATSAQEIAANLAEVV